MKYISIIALIGAASSIKIENEYPVWGAINPPEGMNAVVKRGAEDFSNNYVDMAMKANPSNAGQYPVPKVDYTPEDGLPKPHFAK